MKPIIQDPTQLTVLYRRYRDELCQQDSQLPERLLRGALQMAYFSELAQSFDLILMNQLIEHL